MHMNRRERIGLTMNMMDDLTQRLESCRAEKRTNRKKERRTSDKNRALTSCAGWASGKRLGRSNKSLAFVSVAGSTAAAGRYAAFDARVVVLVVFGLRRPLEIRSAVRGSEASSGDGA